MTSQPTFAPCTACQTPTMGGGECFDCTCKRERLGDAIRTFDGTIPELFRWARFGATELDRRVSNRKAVGVALASVGSTRVTLTGTSGCGKTSLAVAMGRAWVKANAQAARFALATDLATARMRTPFGRESSEVTEAIGAPMLVLDDLGTDKDVNNSAVTEVVFKRHAEVRTTIVTTWMTPEEMAKRYGDGVSRRVFGGARIIDCGGA